MEEENAVAPDDTSRELTIHEMHHTPLNFVLVTNVIFHDCDPEIWMEEVVEVVGWHGCEWEVRMMMMIMRRTRIDKC